MRVITWYKQHLSSIMMLENMKGDKRTGNKLEESLPFHFLRTEYVLDWSSEQQHGAMLNSFEFSE